MTFLPPDILARVTEREGAARLAWAPLCAVLENDRVGALAGEVAARLAGAGHETLLVGGCVRDSLLGREVKEFDVATTALPEQVEALFPRTLPVGRSFGVVMVMVEGVRFEVATFRTDLSYSDGRHPDAVEFSTRREDARRRDFTVNALYFDPRTAEIIDDVGGLQDLAAGVIRAIGEADERFTEDRLRMMRAARFAARLGFTVEAATAEAIRRRASEITHVSAERIQEELRKILTAERPADGMRMLDALGLLEQIFPVVRDMKACPQPPNYHPEGDVFVHTMLSLEKLAPYPPFVLAMATFLHDVGKPEAARRTGEMRFTAHASIGERMTEAICRGLKMSNEETERVCWLVKRHMCFKDADRMRQSKLKRLIREPDFELLGELHRVDALASWGILEKYDYVMDFRKTLPPEEMRPQRLITGEDLIAAGYEPGPAFKRILERVEDAQLEGTVQTREEAMRLAKGVAERMHVARKTE